MGNIFLAEDVSWSRAWQSKGFRVQAIVVVVVLVSMMIGAPYFFDYIERRTGTLLYDLLLDIIPGRNVSWMIFFFLYAGVTIGVYSLRNKPVYMLLAFLSYTIVMCMRLVAISCLPLEPPVGYIPLKEPVVQYLFTSDGRIISKDLFFSGHMCSLLPLIYSVCSKSIRWLLIVFVTIVGVLLLVQHAHYTIDLLAAPLGTWLAWIIAKRIMGSITV